MVLALTGGSAFFRCFIQVQSLNGLSYEVTADPFHWQDIIWSVLWAALFFVGWRYLLKLAAVNNHEAHSVRNLRNAVFPFLLFIPFLFLPLRYYSIIALMLLMVICTFRLVAAWTVFMRLKIGKRTATLVLLLLSLCGLYYGYWIQQRSFDSLYLPYWDWGIFLNSIDNTAKGLWFYSNHEKFNFLARHFSPVLVLFVPYMMIFRSVYAFFLLNTAILVSGGVMLFILCRKLKLKMITALTLAFCYLLSPSIINLNLSVMNGFHVIYLFFPVLMLFFIFFESGNWTGMYLTFLFSLMIKETTGAFWLGAGIAIALSYPKQRRHGLVMAVVGMCWLILYMKVVQPALAPAGGGTSSLYRYAHLGGTEVEIALSPILSPVIFWKTLLRPSCIYFILLLMLPFVCIVPGRFILAAGAFPVLFFSILQQSSQLQNLHMQYQTMTLALLWCVAAVCLKDIRNRRISRWYSWLLFKMEVGRERNRLIPAAAASLVCGVVLANFFVAINPVGKELIGKLTDTRDFSPYVKELKKMIPVGEQVAAPPRLSGHLILHADVYTGYEQSRQFMLLDLGDSLAQGVELEKTRKRLLMDPAYGLIYNRVVGGRRWMLFKQMETSQERKSMLLRMTPEQWSRIGFPVKVKNHDFEVRIMPLNEGGNTKVLRCLFRLKHEVECDYIFNVRAFSQTGEQYWTLHFGDGAEPAYMAAPGAVYVADLRIPDRLGKLRGAGVMVSPLTIPQ